MYSVFCNDLSQSTLTTNNIYKCVWSTNAYDWNER